MSVKILSDSGCDLPIDIINEYDIDILPIAVIKDEKEYLDQETITPKEVYDGMRNGEIFKTAQVSLLSFVNKFEEYAKNNKSVIYLSLSSGISGTYQSAVLAEQEIKERFPESDITVIDSKAASLGFGLIVYEAARLAKAGETKDVIIKSINTYIENIEQIFTVDNLEYLYRGGRVTKTAAFVGGLLNIKPILEVTKEGKLVPFEKIRGRSKVLKRMVEIMKERSRGEDYSDQLIAISHGDDLEAAEKLKSIIEETYGTKKFLINTIGAGIGAHSGPGTIALFFLCK
jgi:DegV family protein with EDD domain